MSLAIENAASFVEGPVAPGEIVTIRGTDFAPDIAALQQIGPDGRVTTELAGVRVWFDQIPAPVLYVQAQQINAIAPWEIAGQTVTQIRVEYEGVSTNAVRIPVAQSAPAIFRISPTTRNGAILNADGTVNGPTNRAKRGTVVAIFGTGGGVTAPIGVTGGFWGMDSLPQLTLPVAVRIGDANAQVVYAGAAPTLASGQFQINVRLPDTLRPARHGVELSIGEARSPLFGDGTPALIDIE